MLDLRIGYWLSRWRRSWWVSRLLDLSIDYWLSRWRRSWWVSRLLDLSIDYWFVFSGRWRSISWWVSTGLERKYMQNNIYEI